MNQHVTLYPMSRRFAYFLYWWQNPLDMVCHNVETGTLLNNVNQHATFVLGQLVKQFTCIARQLDTRTTMLWLLSKDISTFYIHAGLNIKSMCALGIIKWCTLLLQQCVVVPGITWLTYLFIFIWYLGENNRIFTQVVGWLFYEPLIQFICYSWVVPPIHSMTYRVQIAVWKVN